jgi:hypothetical protein
MKIIKALITFKDMTGKESIGMNKKLNDHCIWNNGTYILVFNGNPNKVEKKS